MTLFITYILIALSVGRLNLLQEDKCRDLMLELLLDKGYITKMPDYDGYLITTRGKNFLNKVQEVCEKETV